ncbi:MAG: hypothetical protein HYT75_05105 [Deltaproteobacteria bacterium]|nr:hypothetical protein [Deltaproteobacteria bacterium]
MNYLLLLTVFFSFIGNSYADDRPIPDIYDVQKAALDYARIKPDELSDMKRRARIAAALPRIQVGAKKAFQNDIDISINDNVSVTTDGTTIGPETTDLQQSSDNDTSIEVKAVWSLNELVFNHDMLDVAEEARYQIRERRQILSEVNRLFFEWLELAKGIKKPDAKKDRFQSPYLIEELTAELDALTGGWFSNQIK